MLKLLFNNRSTRELLIRRLNTRSTRELLIIEVTEKRRCKNLSRTSEYYRSKDLHLVKSTFKGYTERYFIHIIMPRGSV